MLTGFYALKSPFATPVQALAKIQTPAQWDKYKNSFIFNLLPFNRNNLRLGERYENNIFFLTILTKEIKEGLEIAKIYYQKAQTYWNKP